MSAAFNELAKLNDEEKIDILVVSVRYLSSNMKNRLNEKGIKIFDIPKSIKMICFSKLSKTTKHFYKDDLMKTISNSRSQIVAETVLKLLQATLSCWLNH